jgi:lactate permease
LINIFGFLVPVFMLWVLVSSQKDKKRQFREGLAFALWSGIAFVIPSAAIAFFGQEFPSILGAVVGIALVFLTTRLGFFLPPKTRSLQPTPPPETILPLSKVLFPYVFLIVLLVLGKLLLGSSSLSFTLGVRQTINLFNPGLAFILAGLWLAVVWNKKNLVSQTLRLSSQRAFEPFLVIAAISALGQLMINSGQNLSGFPSALTLIAQKFETPALPFWTPFIGAFGSFITGSATVSNIMFGSFLEFAGKVMGLATNKILSLALVGAAAGNMIALADILAAETVVGLKNREREVLKGVILPCLIYILLVGLVGIFIT